MAEKFGTDFRSHELKRLAKRSEASAIPQDWGIASHPHPHYEYLGAIVRQKIKSFQAIKANALMGMPYNYRDLPIDDVRDVGW